MLAAARMGLFCGIENGSIRPPVDVDSGDIWSLAVELSQMK
jgi:hypothetical protein